MMGASEATFTLAPTVILRLDAEGTLGVVTAGEGPEEALLVFRGPEDARGYQRTTGKHATAEGFQLIGMGEEAVAALLDKHGLSWVLMPEPWTGDASSGVDLFTRENFIRFLEECAPA